MLMGKLLDKIATAWKYKREIATHVFEIPYLYLRSSVELVEVPLDICINSFGFSYSRNGWHPVSALLKEINICDQRKNLEDSVFYKFYERYRPENMGHLVRSFNSNVAFSPPVGILPWGGFAKKTLQSGGHELKKTSWLCGPLDEHSIRLNIKRSVTLYNRMRNCGYNPWRINNSFIEGCFLVNKRGEKRFIIMHGKHRAAVLSFLGFEKILARYAPESVRTIKETNVDDWFYVKTKQCSVQDALAYFHAYFKLTGAERAKELGLL